MTRFADTKTISKQQEALGDLHPDIIGFKEEIAKKFPNVRYTSGFRPDAKTKQGKLSRHATKEAVDAVAEREFYNFLTNDREGVSLMNKYNLGILDETSAEMLAKTGGTGAHYHIGKDMQLVAQTKARFNKLGEMEVPKRTKLELNDNLPIQYAEQIQITEKPKEEEEAVDVAKQSLEVKMGLKEELLTALQKAQIQPLERVVDNTPQQIEPFRSPYEGLMQDGGIVDNYGNNINSTIINKNIPRSNYDPKTNSFNLGYDYRDMSIEQQKNVLTHENAHGLQYSNNRTNFNITHNPEYAFNERLQKKPNLLNTDEIWNNYHNRKSVEVNQDLRQLKQNNPELQFVNNDILFNKIVDSNQYNNPSTMEGEASQYEKYGVAPFKKGGVIGKNSITPKYQDGGNIIEDDMGYWNPSNWGKDVKINSPFITMRGVFEPLIGISEQTGEVKIMLPNQEYFFDSTQSVVEKPLIKKKLKLKNK